MFCLLAGLLVGASSASAGPSLTFKYPNPAVDSVCPVAKSAVVWDSGLRYIPQKNFSELVVQRNASDFCIVNVFADVNTRPKGQQVKFCVQEVLDKKTNQHYLGLTFLNPQFAETTFLAPAGMKEINRDVNKSIHVEKVNMSKTYVEGLTRDIRGQIKLIRRHQDGNDGLSPIMVLYKIPE
jgi:hypothetical protein